MNYIYKIINIETKDFYVGRTNNPKQRMNRHFSELKRNCHHSILLQRAYNKYGKNNFIFEIVREDLDFEEAQLMENSLFQQAKYNVSQQSSGGDLISNHPNKEIIVDKIRSSIVERYSKMSAKEKKIKHGMPGDRNPMYNKNHSDETRSKMSANRKPAWNKGLSIKFSEEHKKNLSKSHLGKTPWNKGRKTGPLSEEHKKKIAEANSGKTATNYRLVSCEGVFYNSVEEAAKAYGITSAGMVVRLKSKTDRMKDFYYIEENAERLSKPHESEKGVE